MLKLTKRSDYGLIALTHLALTRPGGSASAKEIAETYGIPLPLLAKVLQALARRGLLESAHGTNGGYRLSRDPHTISALEVIRTIDGPVTLTSCSASGQECGQSGKCTIREPLRKVHDGILRLLDSVTISEMVDQPERPGGFPLILCEDR
jgi:Rrf2 family protein